MERAIFFYVVHSTFSAVHDSGRLDVASGSNGRLVLEIEAQFYKFASGRTSENGGFRSVVAESGLRPNGLSGEVRVSGESNGNISGSAESLGNPSTESATGDTPVCRQTAVGHDGRGDGLEVTLEASHLEVGNLGCIASEIPRELESIEETIFNAGVSGFRGLRPHEHVVRVEISFADWGTAGDGIVVSLNGSVEDSDRSVSLGGNVTRFATGTSVKDGTGFTIENGEITIGQFISIVRQEDV
mmetsp:Transcript_5191/g.12391  ORF Transcript_5191/g.12391 Transcript_5191/m.12391 type:complete len:243 (-) Transcript_5191:612-1340(-)